MNVVGRLFGWFVLGAIYYREGAHAFSVGYTQGEVSLRAHIVSRTLFFATKKTTTSRSTTTPLALPVRLSRGLILWGSSPEQVDSDAIVNGDSIATSPDMNAYVKELLPVAPALSFRKFLTMQERRVVVTIRYAEYAGWKPYYLTAAKKIKASHPDVLLEKRVLPTIEGEEIFEIAVDGKMVIGNQAKESTTRKVFCNMVELDLAISRARRRHRPSTTYGIVASDEETGKEADKE